MTEENIKNIKREANKNFNFRKESKRQIIISSSISNRNKVLYTNYPLRKLEIINNLLEKNDKKNDRVKGRRIFERTAKI